MTMTVGSICTGYAGLEMAVTATLGPVDLRWVSEIDPAANQVLTERHPGVSNVGDITQIPDLSPVDIVTAGFPCQPISAAGRHKGVDDERWIWPQILEAVRRMDPPPTLFMLENVPRLLTINDGDAMAQVVEGLASAGFMGRYRLLRASDVGACHGRRRWFCVAAHPDRLRVRPVRGDDLRDASLDGDREPAHVPTRPEMALPEDTPPGRLVPTPAASDGDRGPDYARARDRRESHGSGGDDLVTAVAKMIPTPAASNAKDWTDTRAGPDTIGKARGEGGAGTLVDLGVLLPTPSASLGDAGHTSRSGDRQDELLLGGILRNLPTPTATDARGGRSIYGTGRETGYGRTMSDVAHWEIWGDYTTAINQHIAAAGILPPDPVDEGRRLNPAFVEWMMMIPPGWVTSIDIPRTAQLRILGNGVVPHQAATAYQLILDEMLT